MKRNKKETDEVISKLEAERDLLEDQLISERIQLAKKIDAVRAKKDYITFMSSGCMSAIVDAIIGLLPELEGEEMMLIRKLNNGETIQQIAESQMVPETKLRQTVIRASIRISKLASYYHYLDQENRRLYNRCETQSAHITKLRREIAHLKQGGNASLRDKCERINIESLNLSNRSLWALTNIGIITVADLLELSQRDLANFRNIGKKSYKEIIDAIDSLSERLGSKLSLGMYKQNNN